MSVISLAPAAAGEAAAASLIHALGKRLAITPRRGSDGSWEFAFSAGYTDAHATVVDALNDVDPDWPARVSVEYALTI
jgi:hypothetical protein